MTYTLLWRSSLSVLKRIYGSVGLFAGRRLLLMTINSFGECPTASRRTRKQLLAAEISESVFCLRCVVRAALGELSKRRGPERNGGRIKGRRLVGLF